MKKFVQHIQGQEPWQEKHFDKDLLALSSKWQQRNSKVLSQLLNFCKQDKRSSNKLINNRANLATCKMGNRHKRQIATSSRKFSICSCGSRIFHKMDRRKASYKYVFLHNEKVLMAALQSKGTLQ
jgi:hypothetical protein